MISLMNETNHCEYIIDTQKELGLVPKQTHGDIVLVIETGDLFILDGKYQWQPFGKED